MTNARNSFKLYSKTKEIFKGRRFDVLEIEFEKVGGKKIEREIVSHPGAVVILPLLDLDHVILIRNTRDAVGETLWELPAGTLEYREEPVVCARRELEEETGYQATKMQQFLEIYSTPGFCNEKLHIFLAEDLTFVG